MSVRRGSVSYVGLSMTMLVLIFVSFFMLEGEVNAQHKSTTATSNQSNTTVGIADEEDGGALDISKDPLVYIILGASLGGGGIVGFLLRVLIDARTLEVNRRNNLRIHVMQQIENTSSSYVRLSTCANYLSAVLTNYIIEIEKLQLLPRETISTEYQDQNAKTEASVKNVMYFGTLFRRIINDEFTMAGKGYFLVDDWANTSIASLDAKLIRLFRNLRLNLSVTLKYVNSKTELPEFRASLDNNDYGDLREAYDVFHLSLVNEYKQVKECAYHAQAYSDLFQQQIGKLYKDWHNTGFFSFFSKDEEDDILKSMQKNPPYSLLSPIKLLIKKATEDYVSERESYVSRISDNPVDIENDPKIFLDLGWNYYNSEKYDLAIKYYNEARNLQGYLSDGTAENNLGNLYSTIGDYMSARTQFQEAVKIHNKNPLFHANSARMSYKHSKDKKTAKKDIQKHLQEAEQEFRKAIELDFHNPYYRYELSQVMLNDVKDRSAEIIELCNTAIALQPTEPRLYSMLAKAYEKMNKSSSAIEACKKAVEVSPRKTQFRYELGDLYGRQKNWEEAVREYQHTLLSYDFDTDYAVKTIGAINRTGSEVDDEIYHKIIIGCENAIHANPVVAKNHYNLGKVYLANRSYDYALYEFDKAVSLDQGRNEEYYRQLGYIHLHHGHWDLAIVSYRDALEIMAGDIISLKQLGLAYLKIGKYELAILELNKALAVCPDAEVMMLLSIAYTCNTSIDLKKAQPYSDRAMNLAGDICSPLIISGDVHFLKGRYSQAIKNYQRALDICTISEQDDLVLLLLDRTPGRISTSPRPQNSYRSHLIERLISAYRLELRQLEANGSERHDLWFALGDIYLFKDDFSSAATGYVNALNTKPQDGRYKAHFLYARGMQQFGAGEYDDAARNWENLLHLITSAPILSRVFDAALIHFKLGCVYNNLGNNNKAVVNYELASAIESEKVDIHSEIASVYLRQYDFRRALHEFQQSRRVRPKDAELSWKIGNCYYLMSRSDLAQKEWNEAISYDKHHSRAFYNLGVLCYNEGQIGKAENLWLKAIFHDAKLAESFYNLGIIKFHEGNKDEASEMWRKALEASPQFIPLIGYVEIKDKGRSQQPICGIIVTR